MCFRIGGFGLASGRLLSDPVYAHRVTADAGFTRLARFRASDFRAAVNIRKKVYVTGKARVNRVRFGSHVGSVGTVALFLQNDVFLHCLHFLHVNNDQKPKFVEIVIRLGSPDEVGRPNPARLLKFPW